MAVRNSRVSLRARLTIAAVSTGAVAIVAFTLLTFAARAGGAPTASASTANREQLRQQAMHKIAGLPLYFEVNRGQVDPSVRYLARSGRYSLFLTNDAAVFSLIGGEVHKSLSPTGASRLTESAVRVRLVGANPHPEVEGLEPLPGRVNYLVGDQKNWHRDIPTFGRVRFHGVYPGVDVVYYGTPSALEYDFVAAPGADTSKIKFAIEGPATTTQTAKGDLLIATASGTITISRPKNYQQSTDGSRTPVEGSFKLAKDSALVAGVPTRQVALELAGYDRSRALYIDPVVIPYSTYFGGSASSIGILNLEQYSQVLLGTPIPGVAESGLDVALDAASPPNAYITGSAFSNDLPTNGFFQPALAGANSPPNQNPNVFVAEFNTNASNAASLIYATYLGAAGDTIADDVGDGDGDLGFGIAVDGSGDAYVVGQTYSGNPNSTGAQFPGVASCGAWGTTGTNNGMNADTNVGFVSELTAGGDSLEYSCYIPGSHNATAARVALVPGCSSDCDAFIVGSTQSTVADGFVVTANAPQANLATGEGGLSNAFMMIVGGDGAGSTPVFSSYYGGTGNGSEGDEGLAITVASLNEVAITGATFSGASGKTADKIPLANAAQSNFLGGATRSMAFVASFNQSKPAAQALLYGTYVGGAGTTNELTGIAIGDFGTAIVHDSSVDEFLDRGTDCIDQLSGQWSDGRQYDQSALSSRERA